MRYRFGPSGGYYTFDKKTSKNKPHLSTIGLYQALERGPLKKCELVDVAHSINETGATSKTQSGYLSSTIAWHTSNGRFQRVRVGKFSYFFLTTKGRHYAKERGIL